MIGCLKAHDFIDWPELVTADPGDVFWVYWNLDFGVTNMNLLPGVPYAAGPTLYFWTTSRQSEKYLGSMAQPLRPVRNAAIPVGTVEEAGFNTVPTILSSVLFSLGPPLSHPSVSPSVDIDRKGPPFLPLVFTPASTALSAALMVLFHLVGASISGPSTTVVPASANFGGDPLFGPRLAVAGRSSDYVLLASPEHLQSRRAVVSAGAFSAGTINDSTSATISLARQLSIANCQRDSARRKLAAIAVVQRKDWTENDDLRLS